MNNDTQLFFHLEGSSKSDAFQSKHSPSGTFSMKPIILLRLSLVFFSKKNPVKFKVHYMINFIVGNQKPPWSSL